MDMKVIHILGASGSGTTTLGKALHDRFGYAHFDTDDYFWLPTDPPFTTKRDTQRCQELLKDHMAKANKCVITGSLVGWGEMFIPDLSLVIVLKTPTELRAQRIQKREEMRFGDRVLENGDLYESTKAFIEWAKTYDTADATTRSAKRTEQWLQLIACPIITLDGSHAVEENVNAISHAGAQLFSKSGAFTHRLRLQI